MKTKYLIVTFVFFAILSSKAQNENIISFSSIKPQLIEFLIKTNNNGSFELENYKNGKSTIAIFGHEKEYKSAEKVNDGIYSFSETTTHSKVYYMIYKDSKCKILDIGTREGLDKSLKDVIIFCEENKYCVAITNDYVTRIIRSFYIINKNPNMRYDINCEFGIHDISKLP